jgi:integral membrane protein (TIGR01906 family)
MTSSRARIVASILVVLATPCVVVAAAVALFLNPIWVGLEQDRCGVPALTGYSPAEVQRVTGGILSDLVFGPPNFTAADDSGSTVLDPRERSHMADVRNVLLELGLVALIAALALAAVAVASRGRRWFWRAVALGGQVTIVGVAVVGIGFAIFFEQAFELFHELFFSPGTYSFDPNGEKLVQLFPDQFWAETSVAIALAVLGIALIVGFLAGRGASRPEPSVGPAPVLADTAGAR